MMKKRFAMCIDNKDYPASLDIRKVYRLLPDAEAEKDGWLRVIDESGEDYLYPEGRFVPVDIPKPAEKTFEPAEKAGS